MTIYYLMWLAIDLFLIAIIAHITWRIQGLFNKNTVNYIAHGSLLGAVIAFMLAVNLAFVGGV